MKPDEQRRAERAVEEALSSLRSAPVPEGPPGDVVEKTLRRLAAESRKPALLVIFRSIRSMRPAAKCAAAAAFLTIAAILATTSGTPPRAAYALEETMEAVKTVRFMHLRDWLPDGTLRDERWIEIGPHGRQVRYRQETKRDGDRFFVVEDAGTVAVFRDDKRAVVLYTSEQQQYQWVGDFHQFFADMAGDSSVTVEQNVEHSGRRVHRIRWLRLNTECLIDPDTKLPVTCFGYDISYERPAPGTFDVVIPKGYAVVDARPGRVPADLPDWFTEERDREQAADKAFDQARRALAEGDYATAQRLFEETVQEQPRRNWAWFWQGTARFKQNDFDGAIECYDRVIEMLDPEYCRLARGMAYAAKARLADPEAAEAWLQKARTDFRKALPNMIAALRDTRGAAMYDYADDPLYRSDPGRRPAPEESFARMIERLQAATGQDFGYKPGAGPEETERVVAAWETWWAEHKAEYGLRP